MLSLIKWISFFISGFLFCSQRYPYIESRVLYSLVFKGSTTWLVSNYKRFHHSNLFSRVFQDIFEWIPTCRTTSGYCGRLSDPSKPLFAFIRPIFCLTEIYLTIFSEFDQNYNSVKPSWHESHDILAGYNDMRICSELRFRLIQGRFQPKKIF